MFTVFTMHCKGIIGFECSKKTEMDETMIVGFVFNRNWKSIQQKLLHIKILAYIKKISVQHILRVLQTFLQLHSSFYKETHLFVHLC